MAVVACFIFCEVRIALSVGTQTFYIYLLNNHRVLTLESFAQGQYLTILCDIRATGKYHIRSGLTDAGRGIDIAAMDACRLLLDHLFAEDVLTDDAVGRGEVEDDLCALNSQLRRRRQR